MPLSDYTELLNWIKPQHTFGDIVEIGVLIGSGTKQLAEAFPMKKIWAVDTFNIMTDDTKNQDGVPMWKFYESEIGGKDQYELYRENVSGWKYKNVKTIIGRSIDFKPPDSIFLSIIDGGHSPEVAKIDFENLKHSKFVAFHDYRHDIPELTKAIDEMTEGMKKHVVAGWLIVVN